MSTTRRVFAAALCGAGWLAGMVTAALVIIMSRKAARQALTPTLSRKRGRGG
ncbi:MAG: hypothetical protein BroJett029_01970 [Alphaproteobacteria bacterium]|nr:MAG: hypothetical protein BroJett029_01970 [Alphaproteobacteria bacterium]